MLGREARGPALQWRCTAHRLLWAGEGRTAWWLWGHSPSPGSSNTHTTREQFLQSLGLCVV